MTHHYFDKNPETIHNYQIINEVIKHKEFRFKTDTSVFSRDRMDYGSKFLVETLIQELNHPAEKLLELGSGYGPILISLAKFFPEMKLMGIEINHRAFELALENQVLNSVDNIEWKQGDVQILNIPDKFNFVVTNPPIRAGKSVVQKFAQVAYQCLQKDGLYYVVIQKKQGAPSMRKYLETIFEESEKIAHSKGYWILRAKK